MLVSSFLGDYHTAVVLSRMATSLLHAIWTYCVKSLVIGMILQGQFQLKILSTSCWIVECFTLSGTISPSSSSPPPYQGNPRIVMLSLFLIIVIMCKL